MKTKLFLMFVAIILFSSCEKDKFQPNSSMFHSNLVVFTDLEKTHIANKYNIQKGRTTTSEYDWDGDVVAVNGPAGYEPLYKKATHKFGHKYRQEIMPDTTKLCVGCMQERIIQEYLYLRQDYPAEKAFNKMRLAVPKDLYEVYPRLFELFLSAEMEYLTGQIGGDPDYYSGKRSFTKEKKIANIFYSEDSEFQDPWGCNCSPYIYVLEYYKRFTPGAKKSLSLPNDDVDVGFLQATFAHQRYIEFNSKYAGIVEDYQTKYDEAEAVYYLDIPAY